MSLPYPHPPLKPAPPGLIARLQAAYNALRNQSGGAPTLTSAAGEKQDSDTLAEHSPSTFDTKIVTLEYGRRAVAEDINRLFSTDPRLAEAAESMGRDAVEGGIRVQVLPREGIGTEFVADAQKIIDGLLPRLNGTLPSVFTNIVLDGEVFLSPVVAGVTIQGFKMPVAVSVERLDDERGNFIDVQKAFRQIDLGNFMELESFPLWQICHIRYGRRPGDKYGRSRVMQIRGPLRLVEEMENDMVVARKTRAPLRRFHSVGTKDNPQDWGQVQKYKSENSLDKPNHQKITLDYFGNGLTDAKNLDGQSNLHQIEDVEYLQRVALTRLGKPMALMPAFGQNINRDILDKQEQEYNKLLNGLRHLVENGDGGLYSGLRDILDFALSIVGYNPDAVTYNVQWPRHFTKDQIDFVDKVSGWVATSFIDHETGLSMVAPILGIESAQDVMTKVAKQRVERMAEEAGGDDEYVAKKTNARFTGPDDARRSAGKLGDDGGLVE